MGVLGASLKTADPLTLYTSFCDHIFGNAAWVKYVIGIPLIFALLLSVLNAIMGVARSLFQASEDRLLPRFFEHKNKYHVPDRAMAFNVVCALIVSLFGSPVRIYIFSNVGYLVAVGASLYGYFLLRQFRSERVSPFRMPGWFRWIALVCGLFLTFDWIVGGWNSPDIVVGPGQGHFLYILGLVIVAAYVPLYWWRKLSDRRLGITDSDEVPVVVGSPGGIDLDPPRPNSRYWGRRGRERSRRCQPCATPNCDLGLGGSAGGAPASDPSFRAAEVRQATVAIGGGADRGTAGRSHSARRRAGRAGTQRRGTGGCGDHCPDLRLVDGSPQSRPDADPKGDRDPEEPGRGDLAPDREGREPSLGPGGRLPQAGQDHCASGEGAPGPTCHRRPDPSHEKMARGRRRGRGQGDRPQARARGQRGRRQSLANGGAVVAIYLSMQRVRFSSPDGYDKFRTVFSNVRHHLMSKPGFIHLTWWEHPDEPGWYNEVSMWASKEAVNDWHMDTYHKHAKEWAAGGAIMEDIISNFELVGTRLLRICPTCGTLQDKPYDMLAELKTLGEPCPKCGFVFPVSETTANSTTVAKDVI